METDTGDISPTEGNCEPEDNTPDIPGTDATNSSTRDAGAVTFGDKIKSKIGKLWNGLDFFCKVVTIATVVTSISKNAILPDDGQHAVYIFDLYERCCPPPGCTVM